MVAAVVMTTSKFKFCWLTILSDAYPISRVACSVSSVVQWKFKLPETTNLLRKQFDLYITSSLHLQHEL